MKKKSLADDILEGLEQALAYTQGKNVPGLTVKNIKIKPVKEIKPAGIKKVRKSLHMSQQIFAEILGVSKKTIEAWENGSRKPTGSALRLIEILKNDSKVANNFIKIA
jgi:putative transcriptional regulator